MVLREGWTTWGKGANTRKSKTGDAPWRNKNFSPAELLFLFSRSLWHLWYPKQSLATVYWYLLKITATSCYNIHHVKKCYVMKDKKAAKLFMHRENQVETRVRSWSSIYLVQNVKTLQRISGLSGLGVRPRLRQRKRLLAIFLQPPPAIFPTSTREKSDKDESDNDLVIWWAQWVSSIKGQWHTVIWSLWKE